MVDDQVWIPAGQPWGTSTKYKRRFWSHKRQVAELTEPKYEN